MMKHYAIIGAAAVVALAILGGCGSKTETADQGEKVTEFTVPADELSGDELEKFDNMLDLALIRFETNDSSVFAPGKVVTTPDALVLWDYRTHLFHIFGRDGRYIRSFSKNGQGDKEIAAMYDYGVDNGELYVLTPTNIKVYDLEGNWLRTIPDIKESRSDMTVGGGKIYLHHGYSNEYQLEVRDAKTGALEAELMPSREVMRNFAIPVGPEQASRPYANGAVMAFPTDPTLYEVNDTVVTPMAHFDFGSRSISSDFFSDDPEYIENRWHAVRVDGGNFIYIDYPAATENLVAIDAIGVWQMGRRPTIFADRRDGKVYNYPHTKGAPNTGVLNMLMPKAFYIVGTDPTTDSFAYFVDPGTIKDILEEGGAPAEKLRSYAAFASLDPASISEDDNSYLLLVTTK